MWNMIPKDFNTSCEDIDATDLGEMRVEKSISSIGRQPVCLLSLLRNRKTD
jgi:hypothetical protein